MAQSTSDTQNTDLMKAPIDEVFKTIVKTDKGFSVPEEVKKSLSGDRLALVTAEARRRTTESNLAKARQAELDLKAKLEAQAKLYAPKVELDPQEQERLDTLKYEDPDAWLKEVNKVKAQAEEQLANKFTTAYEEEKAKLLAENSKLTGQAALDAYNASTEYKLSEENLEFDAPPRLKQRLADGEITYSEFFDVVSDYVYTKKRVNSKDVNEEPEFEQQTGKNHKQQETFEESYTNAIF